MNPQAKATAGPEANPVAVPDAKRAIAAKLDPPQWPAATLPDSPGRAATPPAAAADATEPAQQGMSHSCICNGENENCRYCHGSGIMDDRLRPAFDDYSVRRRAIEESKAKASPRPWWWNPSYTSVLLPPEIKCPKGCGRWVEVQEAHSHLTNCTGVRGALAQKTEHTPSSIAKAGDGRPAQVTSDRDPTRQHTDFLAPRDKNLDATKLYAHPCREQQGKYGSHPSHDGFDDESSPD